MTKKEIDKIIEDTENNFNSLIGSLPNIDDTSLLNEVVLYLGDRKVQRGLPEIIKLIKNEKFINQRGSFLYAIRELDCSKYLIGLLEILKVGNFECKEMVILILENIEVNELDRNILNEARKFLQSTEITEENQNYVDYIMEVLKI